MTTNIENLKRDLSERGMTVKYGETHPISGWNNCGWMWITPTFKISKLSSSFEYLYGEKIPDEFKYMVSVSNTTETGRTYSPHGEYVYLVGDNGPVMVDYDDEERCLEMVPVKFPPSNEEWYYNNIITPFGWADEDQKLLLDILRNL